MARSRSSSLSVARVGRTAGESRPVAQALLDAPGVDVLVVEDLGQQHLAARMCVSALRRAGLSALLCHWAPSDDLVGFIALATRCCPRLIAFSILFAHGVPEHLRLVEALRAAGLRAHITLMGPLPSFAHAELLNACSALDSVACGEPEDTCVALGKALVLSTDWRAVPGIACRAPQSLANPIRKARLHLGDHLTPVRDATMPSCLGVGFATVAASRGCYHQCTFCLPCAFYRQVSGSAYRWRRVSDLIDEMEALYRQGVRLFLFDDEQFLPPRVWRTERVAELALELQKRDLHIAFTIKCRPDDVERGLFERLRGMGLVRAYVGLESGCGESLELFGKGVSVQDNRNALSLLDELGIVADFRSLLFHPWSTLGMLREELAFLQSSLQLTPTLYSLREVEVYPGTALAERLRAEGRGLGTPWPLEYMVGDARAELARRLVRLVFGPSGSLECQDAVSQAWFQLLVRRHLTPSDDASEQALALKVLVRRLNAGVVNLLAEMVAYAETGPLCDATQVNNRGGEWASRARAIEDEAGLVNTLRQLGLGGLATAA